MEYLLNPQYNRQKSFYQKAKIRIEGGKTILKSYSTDVAYIENNQAFIKGFYSNTTSKHIKEFLLQYGFKVLNRKQLENDYLIKA